MQEDLSREEVLALVDTAVMELLEACGIEVPPVDALSIGRHLGIPIREQETASRIRSKKEVVLTPSDSEERRQWLVAQAIGMERKPLLLTRMGIDPEERRGVSGESLSNLFAEHLLLPTRWFHEDAVACGFDLLALKQRYPTAAFETIAFRMLDLPQPCIITLLNEDRLVKRRSNGPQIRKQLSEVEELCWKQVRKSGESRLLGRDGWTVQGWPVGDQQILRTIIEVD